MDKKLAVIGLGYVGLPLAELASEKGWQVFGVDIDEAKVKVVNDGDSISASNSFEKVADASVLVIAVPTPVSDDYTPDLAPLKSAIVGVRDFLQEGQVLIIESTVNPGVMSEIIEPLLAEREDLPSVHLVHCPERINPGDPKWNVSNIPRVLGGTTEEAAKKGKEFYDSILDAEVKIMNSVTEAEAVKILENTFRDINIAYVNEMARSFDKLGIDIVNVIDGAATKPFAFLPHYPGNGVGGHCISVDPYYMIEKARQAGFDHHFLKLARQINDDMSTYAVERLMAGMEGAGLNPAKEKVALLGLSYKKNIDDMRESPALKIKQQLEEKDIMFSVYDPYFPDVALPEAKAMAGKPVGSTVKSLQEALEGVSAVMLATDHDEFVDYLTAENLNKHGVKIILDGKNALDMEGIKKAGVIYLGIGRA